VTTVTNTGQLTVTDRNQSLTIVATCPAGRTLVGGGGEVTDNDAQADHYAVMISSKPVGNTWSVTGYTVIPFVANTQMIVQSWALCAQ
jgi:hypothetical protein